MLHGAQITLRARQEADLPVFQAELYDDVATRSRADNRPWRPVPPGSAQSPYAVTGPSDESACFSVVVTASGELAGEALLWGIDTHNRNAHLGIALRPGHRGRGLATDVLRVLCHYGFPVLGLRRLQLETLADNTPMLRAAAAAGFTVEGTLRRSAWVCGEFADQVVLGLLAEEWRG
ncbi:RimJ/RimL family protein N-acetyltransferase [Streptomyces sp. 1114.5]|uniref:GNAT family N-acetyltransferase n=1 Tax=unclassified Streptomyces TaxID=2593676 RepID=UPI000BCECC07|nr:MULTISPECIES: GNAT family protein [unclassified Streptomyces]RKT19827.1 RimJ/RimL family protein N-acetyltransferase [Streptomyces sp. 1114.5]SOB86026.1 Protein N-acetyltransferase, RimJ/RimL family [Streptomyces sp. 1331.2]